VLQIGSSEVQISVSRIIGTRRLLFSLKGHSARNRFVVCVSEPYELAEGAVEFPFSAGAAGCVIGFEGLDERDMVVYGADTIQALAIAVDSLEKYLRRLSKKYDFYFETGEPYFED
jgi:hypothetical protein